MSLKLNLIVAACENGGIGFKGNLPWKLKKEMAYFTRMTTKVRDESKRNAVIMGRKTWDSIPLKYRPLSGRLNVILSTTLTDVNEGVVCRNLKDAMDYLTHKCNDVENVWVIGGVSIYKLSWDSTYVDKIYYTHIYKNFECDVFLPPIPDKFSEIRDPDVSDELQTENGINYKFKIYQVV